MSGVIQFDQRRGNTRQLRTNIRVSASEATLTLEGPLFKGNEESSKTSFLISGRRSYLQFLFQALGLPILPDYWDYQYKVSHQLNDYDEISLVGLGSIDDFSAGGTQFLPSLWDSRHLLTFIGGYKFKRNWEVSLRYRFSDRAPYVPVNVAATLANYPAIIRDYSQLGSVRLNAFNQADIRIDKEYCSNHNLSHLSKILSPAIREMSRSQAGLYAALHKKQVRYERIG